MPPSKRTHQRHEIAIPVEITYEGQTFGGTSRNLSLGGMFVLCAARIPFGARVILTLTIETPNRLIIAESVVRWVEADAGVGVQFLGLRAAEVWSLQQLFARLDGPA